MKQKTRITLLALCAATICPVGWHVPSKEDFLAMTGLTAAVSDMTNYDAISAAFTTPGGFGSMLASTEEDKFGWRLYFSGPTMGNQTIVWTVSKVYDSTVRCVQKAN